MPALKAALDSPHTSPRLRRQIPRVIAEIPSQLSVDLLLNQLENADAGDSLSLVQALSKLRVSDTRLNCDAARVGRILMARARVYYEMMRLLQIFGRARGKAHNLLEMALREHRACVLEQIFRLLGLQYSAKDMYHAYLGMVSHKKTARANALEFLDNVFMSHHKAILLALIDVNAAENARAHGRNVFGDSLRTREDGMLYLLNGNDIWLKACALNCVDAGDSDALLSRVQTCCTDTHPLISETADLAVRNLGLMA